MSMEASRSNIATNVQIAAFMQARREQAAKETVAYEKAMKQLAKAERRKAALLKVMLQQRGIVDDDSSDASN